MAEHYFLGIGYEQTGRRAEAIPEYQKAVDMSGGDEGPTAALAYAYARQGRKPEAEKILFDLQHGPKAVSPYSLAAINAGLGKEDAALEFIGLKPIQRRDLGLVWFFQPTRVWIVSGPISGSRPFYGRLKFLCEVYGCEKGWMP